MIYKKNIYYACAQVLYKVGKYLKNYITVNSHFLDYHFLSNVID